MYMICSQQNITDYEYGLYFLPHLPNLQFLIVLCHYHNYCFNFFYNHRHALPIQQRLVLNYFKDLCSPTKMDVTRSCDYLCEIRILLKCNFCMQQHTSLKNTITYLYCFIVTPILPVMIITINTVFLCQFQFVYGEQKIANILVNQLNKKETQYKQLYICSCTILYQPYAFWLRKL